MRIETLPRFWQPIVWTLHDMWPFTGGEHYVGENTRYKKGCRSLNRPESDTGRDVNRWIWLRHREACPKAGRGLYLRKKWIDFWRWERNSDRIPPNRTPTAPGICREPSLGLVEKGARYSYIAPLGRIRPRQGKCSRRGAI